MKMNSFFLLLFFLRGLLFSSCGSEGINSAEKTADTLAPVKKKEYEKFETGKVLSYVPCSSRPEMSFALYLPSTYDPEKKYPSLCLFDPHAQGKLPVEKYKDLAEKYGFILACSNNSHNGIIGTKMTDIYTSFFGDIQNRLSVDFDRLYVGGFSGGSRIASYVMLKEYGYAGLVSCGAGWMKVKEPLQNKFCFIGIAGSEDFNLTELSALDKQLDTNNNVSNALVEFEGKHEWPPAEVFENAFLWFEFDAMKKKTILMNETLIKAYVDLLEKKLKELEDKKEWYTLYNTSRQFLAFTEGLTDNPSLKKNFEALSQKAEMKAALNEMNELFANEEKLKQEYSTNMQVKDIAWWKTETDKINGYIKNDKDKKVRQMYSRILSYLSLMAFSRASGALRFNELQGAAFFIRLYKTIDPKNPEHAYLAAVYYARQNATKDAIASLKEALALGFTDYARMVTEKDFASLANNSDFKEMAEKLKPQ